MNIDTILYHKLTRLSQYIDIQYLEIIKKDFKVWNKRHKGVDSDKVKRFIIFLQANMRDNIKEGQRLRRLLQDFLQELTHTSTTLEKEKIILDYAYTFNPSKREQYSDSKAFRRWFDEDALSERIEAKISYIHRYIIVCVERMQVAIDILSQVDLPLSLWKYFDFDNYFLYLLEYREEPMLLHKTFKALLEIVYKFYDIHNKLLLDERLLKLIYKVALSSKETVWIQNNAIEFLALNQIDSFLKIIPVRCKEYRDDDTIFVRHKIALLSFEYLKKEQRLLPLIENYVLKDPSPYVRQAIAKSLSFIQHPKLKNLFKDIVIKDKDSSVRALAIKTISTVPLRHQLFKTIIWDSIFNEKNDFVLKTSLYFLRVFVDNMQKREVDSYFINKSIENLNNFIALDTTQVSLKRYASSIREFLWVALDKNRYKKYVLLLEFIETIEMGKSKKFPLEECEENYRILSVVAQNDFSLELVKSIFGKIKLHRFERFKITLWRILQELRNASPDKRQGYPHTIARRYKGLFHFPSTIVAEQAPTKVPGEPYFIPEEESWRPFIPLPDHFISSLSQDTFKINPYTIYSSDGVTTIMPPKRFYKRFITKMIFSWNYAKISKLRNWREGSTQEPNSYIEKVKSLGFKISFTPYVKNDKSTTQFFAFAFPLTLLDEDTKEQFWNYFISAYENTLSDLGMFLGAIFGLFFIRHLYLSRKISKSRKGIPLSIGGWGTRGKSGTERLKAALFNALGLRVFSKTTGNEAMFLHANSFEQMREMFLFRPYDKATIWEQANTIIIANRLNVDIYLWESMGLTPSYVNILQQVWMNDNIATITNTYPDHEDLQGPAGINIPLVMTNFIPPNSTLVASEEVMYPILKSYAKSVNTKSISTGWLDAGLIPPDILSRFPYEEHPYNIALVLNMARELDINDDEALKAMADNIVPDLGVLKAYPPAKVGTKTLLFINGMSANERFGALGNWKRMGLGDIKRKENPTTFVTTLINNRADRISRSRVFASLVVEDIVADFIILIGSNQSGFINYVEESWKGYQKKISLGKENEKEKLLEYFDKYKIFYTKELLEEFVKMITQKEVDFDVTSKDQTLKNLNKEEQELYLYNFNDYKIAQELLENPNEEKLKSFLWGILKKRIVTVDNYHATGNEVIAKIIEITPLGAFNKIIGMQNIKGTGLDFAYRWVAWNECFKMCEAIKSTNRDEVRVGIDALANFEQQGFLSFDATKEIIEIAKKSTATQTEFYQAQIQRIEQNLNKAKETLSKKDNKEEVKKEGLSQKILTKILEAIESFLDAGDAIKRRERANLIYKDLENKQISHKRAAFELQKITKRQKGSWFVQKFKRK